MTNKFYIIIASLALVVSCKKNEKADVLETTQTVSTVDSSKTDTSKATGNNSAVSANTQAPVITTTTVSPDNKIVSSGGGIQQVPPPAPQKVAPGMNPAHGQPGHRCDIPVGAPLNTPVKSSQNMNVSPSVPVPAPAPAPAPVQNPAPVATAPGTNPPHGQPGHRCDLAVGVPLPK